MGVPATLLKGLTPEAFAEKAGAAAALLRALSHFDRDHAKIAIFHCRSGMRREANALKLLAKGFPQAYSARRLGGLEDGWLAGPRQRQGPVGDHAPSADHRRGLDPPRRGAGVFGPTCLLWSVCLCRRRAGLCRSHLLVWHGAAIEGDAMEQSGFGPMAPQDIAAALSGGLVGFVLAVVGGGGSILATPLLLYAVGIGSPHVAIGTSAVAVSANAFADMIGHARRGNVRWPCATAFAASGVIGAFVGARLGKATDAAILLPLFALVMIAVGVNMLRPRPIAQTQDVRLSPQNATRLLAAGAIVGLASGFFGIGGGFLIVPGLMAATGMTVTHAIGSSLLSVGAFGASTGVSYALAGLVDWRVAAIFIGGGVLGGVIGIAAAKRLETNRALLQRLFAGVIFAAAAYVLYRSIFAP